MNRAMNLRERAIAAWLQESERIEQDRLQAEERKRRERARLTVIALERIAGIAGVQEQLVDPDGWIEIDGLKILGSIVDLGLDGKFYALYMQTRCPECGAWVVWPYACRDLATIGRRLLEDVPEHSCPAKLARVLPADGEIDESPL